MSETLRGSGVSAGVAVGRVALLSSTPEPIVPEEVPPERLDEEIERFHACRRRAKSDLETLRARTRDALGPSYAGILDAQLLIVDDPKLVDRVVRQIRTGRVSASWALRQAVHEFLRRFEAIEDGFFRERGGDLRDVHHRLQRILRSTGGPLDAALGGDEPVVVVAHSLGPSDAAFLTQHDIAGFATDVGGRTSHTAILAQALSVPAVVGLHDVTARSREGQTVILDGTAGSVTLDPDDRAVRRARSRASRTAVADRDAVVPADRPLRTADGVDIRVRANLEFAAEVDRAARFGAQGVGLYRSEFLFLHCSPRFPTENEHFEAYRHIAAAFPEHPTTVRTLDLGGEKYFHEFLEQDEGNPVLGLRGVRLCLRRPDIFRPQLRGLLRAAALHDIRALIPLVTFAEEIREVRRLIAAESAALRAEGIACRDDIPVGAMIEVPAAALTADLLAREADFFAIGTNDLIQYGLAVDRANESVADLYRPRHVAVLRMLRFVLDQARRAGIPASMCGEMAADPDLVECLIGLGLREFSVQPRSLAGVREAVGRVDAARAAERVRERVGVEVVALPVDGPSRG